MIENTDLSSTTKLKIEEKVQSKEVLPKSAKAESSQVVVAEKQETPTDKMQAVLIDTSEKRIDTSEKSTVMPEKRIDTSEKSIDAPKKNKKRSSASLTLSPASSKHLGEAQMLRTRCKQLGLSLLLQEHGPTRSLGFTSAIPGEGKSFIAKLTAEALAEDTSIHVVLLECNWENPTFNSAFGLDSDLGLAEWLQGKSSLKTIRHQITSNFTVIPAGEGKRDTLHLLRELQQRGIRDVLDSPDELLIVDLPATVTTSYGHLAAQLVDALILVVRMGVTPEPLIAQAHDQLKNLPVQGIVLNQITSRIPRWLRQLL